MGDMPHFLKQAAWRGAQGLVSLEGPEVMYRSKACYNTAAPSSCFWLAKIRQYDGYTSPAGVFR